MLCVYFTWRILEVGELKAESELKVLKVPQFRVSLAGLPGLQTQAAESAESAESAYRQTDSFDWDTNPLNSGWRAENV